MAEILINVAVEAIISKAGSLVAEEMKLVLGVKKDLSKLGESLTMIQALLIDAEKRQVSEEAVNLWLRKLKDIAFEADDVLDEVVYEVLRCKVKIQNKMKNKVFNFFSRSNPILFRFQMAHKVKNINISLDVIKIEGNSFPLQPNFIPSPQFTTCRETHSILDTSVVGRDDEISKMKEILINSSSQEAVSIIPIVGMGGMGKTTFAQFVCNDESVKGHYNVMMWVCVSDNFDVKRILKEILESLTKNTCGMDNMDAILQRLQEELGGKRYLLILDDVWNEAPEKWDSLKSCLRRVNSILGNYIIVTTRSNQAASVMGSLPALQLKKLAEEHCWLIFEQKAFSNGGILATPDLVAIGRAMVEKCGGVPLAAKVLGGMMRSKKDKHEWLSIQNSEIWELPDNENGILPALRLSFDHLPSQSLKQCFAYCSIVRKGYYIRKDTIIQQWMAQGLLQPSQGSSLVMEDIGDGYFNTLLSNSLLEDVKMDEYNNCTYWKMHDLVHDLARYVSGSDCMTMAANKMNNISGIRHLSLISTDKSIQQTTMKGGQKLRTLFSQGVVPVDTLVNFKCLRVLNLNSSETEELPASIKNLKHLRYLDISFTNVKRLPDSITELFNLQTLRLMHCDLQEEFPKEFRKLINLRHFCIDNFREERSWMPTDIGQLTSLQTLPLFVVGQDRRCRIEELGCLCNLRAKLNIYGLEHVRGKEEAKKANLLEKSNIYDLELHWSSRREKERNCDGDVLEGLQPHQDLKGLTIENFEGENFPLWMSHMLPLKNLVKIELNSCNRVQRVPTLGKLPSLKILLIRGMINVKCIGSEFYSSNNDSSSCTAKLFPTLREFTLYNMPNLVEWSELVLPSAGAVFPCLEQLYINGCPQLTTIPGGFSKDLDSFPCPNSVDVMQQLVSLKDLTLKGWPKLKSLPEPLQHLTLLKELTVTYFDELVALPDWLGSLSSLELLWFWHCKNLMYLPAVEEMRRLRKLQRLLIGGCPLLEEKCDKRSGSEWYKIAHIPSVTIG
ncbi:hypothetical protein F0562_006094 [Nyssa sinensis]|uniref:Disease resistance protein RGA3 n=1 Tax=Nyssa sinensis TaxID=561372 RepID=A0A5J5AL25_9ASTE|nr:hypothetical protein F0562_006094 [Nyssa sinensis]